MATNGEKAIERPEVYTMDDVFDFGKYKGQTIGDITTLDPDYIFWAMEKVQWFKVTANVLRAAEKAADITF